MKPRKIDLALQQMQEHLNWLVEHRAPTNPQRHEDLIREIGVMECMDILVSHGARRLARVAE